MSEEEGSFDKEAEREKLRKQLEREEEERRSTQHMSELLLKGATMTNKHCDDCGDPIFRYEGQEFCPTCGQEGADNAGEQGGQTVARADTGEAERSADASEADRSTGGAGIDRVETGAAPGPSESGESSSSGAVGSGSPASAGQQPTPGAGGHLGRRGAGGDAGTGDAAAGAGDVDGNVATARAALSRKLAALAGQAEATEDVGRSRELLAAAREAAEALAAIDDVGR